MNGTKTRINDDWCFAELDTDSDDIEDIFGAIGSVIHVCVPHIWSESHTGRAVYFRSIYIDPSQMDKDFVVEFDGVNREAFVYVNSLNAGGHRGGSETFTLDITKFIHTGENELTVLVDNLDDVKNKKGSHGEELGICSDVWLIMTQHRQ